MAPAWTCRPWCATCATASGLPGLHCPALAISPMGDVASRLKPPFGLGSSTCGYSSSRARRCSTRVWPFFVAAWRALERRPQHGGARRAQRRHRLRLQRRRDLLLRGEQFYEASAVLLVFILLGHWLEMRARAGASDAIRALMDLAPPMATVIRDGRRSNCPRPRCSRGDVVIRGRATRFRSTAR